MLDLISCGLVVWIVIAEVEGFENRWNNTCPQGCDQNFDYLIVSKQYPSGLISRKEMTICEYLQTTITKELIFSWQTI